jgi:hypothetical protein
MKLAIMQPYFFPYLGYFSLIEYADRFILFDPVQFIRHGWIERNRILKPGEGWQYINVPLEKYSRSTLIKEIRIKNTTDWQTRILRQIEHYKKRAPFYNDVKELMQYSFAAPATSIVHLNHRCLGAVADYIGIPYHADIFSEMNLEIGDVTHSGEWALRISQAMGASEYINPPGGREIFKPEQFKSAGIKLKFLASNLPEYSQRRPVFENGLSIIDVMMFNSPEDTLALVKEYEFLDE